MNTPPLKQVRALLKAFMDSKTTTEINIEKIYKLVEVAIRDSEKDVIGFAEYMIREVEYVDSTSNGSTYAYKKGIYTTKEILEQFKKLNK